MGSLGTTHRKRNLMFTGEEWETFWQGNTNNEWNTNRVDTNLIEYFPKNSRTALEIGFGSGVNSQWMHSMGAKTTAIEFSPTAVELARKNYPGPTYLEQSVLKETAKTYDFIFDRAVYHMFIPDPLRDSFIKSVYHKMHENSLWLSIVILYGINRTKQYNIQDAIQPLLPLFNVDYYIGSTELSNWNESALIIRSRRK
jgi:2-polyprenyl-3-methyl-5-hydroxy-6-metoxy-1,4-benzoquinol methylase